MSSENLFYEAGRLEGHGNDYQRQVAWLLLQRLILSGKHFKLGFEVTEASKFDDVAVFYEDAWHLIQTKHCQPTKEGTVTDLTKEILFKRSDDAFSILRYVKSYNAIKEMWMHGPIKHIILLTNRSLDPPFDADSYTEVAPSNFLKFSNDSLHIQLIGKKDKREHFQEEIMQILKAEAFKRDLHQIKEAMIKLFEKGLMNPILLVYNVYLKQMLTEADTVSLVDEKQFENTDINKLFRDLKQMLKNKSIHKTKMQTFWIETKDVIRTDISKETVAEFFNKFLLAVSQPNVEELKQVMINEGRIWMREWIRPDNLGKVNQSFFDLPCSVISNEFHGYEKHPVKRDHNGILKTGKLFLQNRDGEVILNKIKEKIIIEIEKVQNHSCANLDLIGYYYINRKITISSTHDENEVMILDTDFAQTKLINSDEHTFFVLTAQPGMGKSTLMQYLAFEVQKMCDNPVFFIYLNNLCDILPTIKNIHDVSSKNFLKSELSNDNVELIINNNETQIILFLDAFDELKENNLNNNQKENQTKMQQLIDVLLKKNNVKIVVSGRRHVREVLINNRNTIFMKIQALGRDDKIKFLRKFWKQSMDDEDNFMQFANYLLNQLDKGISNQKQELIGIPLMLKMVAEIYEGLFEKFLCSKTVDLKKMLPEEKFTILSLYEQFSSKSSQSLINKKFNVNNNKELDSLLDPLNEAIDYDYQVFAIENMLKFSNLLYFITNKKYHETLRSFKNRIENEQSLIVEIVSKHPQFSHLSFGEYFAAKYLFNFICETVVIVCEDEIYECLHLFENVCIFFLTMIDSLISEKSGNTHIFLKKSPRPRIKAKKLLKNLGPDFVFIPCKYDFSNIVQHLFNLHEPLTFEGIRDKGGRTVLEVAIEKQAQNVCNLLKNIILQKSAMQYPLHFAVESSCKELVEHFVNNKTDINLIDENGCTPILRTQNDEVLKLLLNAGANINAQNQKGETLLHIASREGRLKIVMMLVKNGASLELKSNDNKSPFSIACEKFHLSIVHFLQNLNLKLNDEFLEPSKVSLLQLRSDIKNDLRFNISNDNKIYQDRLRKIIDTNVLTKREMTLEEGNIALFIAARLNFKYAVEILLNKQADVSYQDDDGRTPLHFAAENGSYEIVKLLVDRFNDFSRTNIYGDSVLHCAAKYRDSKCLELLIDKFKTSSISLDMSNCGRTALENAIQEKNETNVRLLVNAGANFITLLNPDYHLLSRFRSTTIFPFLIEKAINSSLRQPKHIIAAACVGCDKSVQLLIDAGIDVNFKDDSNIFAFYRTALHRASEHGHCKVLDLLLDNNADVNIADKNGMTPLHLCAKKEEENKFKYCYVHSNVICPCKKKYSFKIYNRLVLAGANEMVKDNDENNILHFASTGGCRELVKHIIDKHNINIDCFNKFGCTALHNAAANGHKETVELLLSNGAYINVKNKNGESPIYKAVIQGNPETVRCLLKYLPDVELTQYEGVLNKNLKYINKDVVEALIAIGVNVNTIDDSGRTILHAAVIKDNEAVAKLSIKAGIEVDAVDNEGNTALHYACQMFSIFNVSYLSDYSTNINQKNKNGDTPLLTAVKHNYHINNNGTFFSDHTNYIKLLITKNASINLADFDGNTLLHLLISKYYNKNNNKYFKTDDYFKTILVLIEHSPEVDRQNKKGETILHLAVCENDYPVVKKLVEKGADLMLKTNEGKTALDLAKGKKCQKIYEYLLDTKLLSSLLSLLVI